MTMKSNDRRRMEQLEPRRLMAAGNYTIVDLGAAPSSSSNTIFVNDVAQNLYAGTRVVSGKEQAFIGTIGASTLTALQPLTGADNAVVTAINNKGEAVGYSYVSGNRNGSVATLWSGGKVFNLGAGSATSISSNGLIAGVSGQLPVKFSRTAAPVSLGTLVSQPSVGTASGINSGGTVVGQSGTRAFSHANGSMFDLSFQGGGSNGFAYAVNNSGVAVGTINNHPFFTAGNVVQYLTERNGSGTAYDVNARGQIVGITGSSDSATLWEGGTGYTLSKLAANLGEWQLDTATDISDDGRIIGYGRLDGERHAFALVPGGGKLNSKGTLIINGSDADDSITVGFKSGRIRVSINGSLQTFTPRRIKRINISAGDGNDTVALGAGVRGAGIDGGAGNDSLSGGDNTDNLFGGSGNDRLIGYGGRDTLSGGTGDDTLLGGSSVDIFDGGTGTDRSDFDRRETRRNIEGIV